LGEIKYVDVPNGAWFDFLIRCQECGISTLSYSTEEEAIEDWNGFPRSSDLKKEIKHLKDRLIMETRWRREAERKLGG